MSSSLSPYVQIAASCSHRNDLDAIRLQGTRPTLQPAQPPSGLWARVRGWFTASPEKQALAGLRRGLAEAYGDRIADAATRPLRGLRAMQVQHLRQALASARDLRHRHLVENEIPLLLARRAPALLPAARAFALAQVAGQDHLVGPTGQSDPDQAVAGALAALARLRQDSGLSDHSLEPILTFALRGRTGPDALAVARQLLDPAGPRPLFDARGVVSGTRVLAGMNPQFVARTLALQTPEAYRQPLGATLLDNIQEDAPREVEVPASETAPGGIVRVAPFTVRDAGASTLVVGGRHWGTVVDDHKPATRLDFAIRLREAFEPGPDGDEMALAVSRCMNQEALQPVVMGGLSQAFGIDHFPLLPHEAIRAFEARPQANGSWLVDCAHGVELHGWDDIDRQGTPLFALFRLRVQVQPAAPRPLLTIQFADVAFSN